MQGSLPVALAAIIIGRDVLLVTGACVDRCRRVCTASVLHAEVLGACISPRIMLLTTRRERSLRGACCTALRGEGYSCR